MRRVFIFVLTVLVVTACLYSLLGSIGFLYIAHSGRHSIRERVSAVLFKMAHEREMLSIR